MSVLDKLLDAVKLNDDYDEDDYLDDDLLDSDDDDFLDDDQEDKPVKKFFQKFCGSVVVIIRSHKICLLFYRIFCIFHHNGNPCFFEHLHIVFVIPRSQ